MGGDQLTLLQLLYRYWFFGWLFRDAHRGNLIERDAALKHNVVQARWLPLYMRRWAMLGALFYAVGIGLEHLALEAVAPIAFVPACLTAPVLAVAIASWLVLRGRGPHSFTRDAGGSRPRALQARARCRNISIVRTKTKPKTHRAHVNVTA